jgi:hypothetical protein
MRLFYLSRIYRPPPTPHVAVTGLAKVYRDKYE